MINLKHNLWLALHNFKLKKCASYEEIRKNPKAQRRIINKRRVIQCIYLLYEPEPASVLLWRINKKIFYIKFVLSVFCLSLESFYKYFGMLVLIQAVGKNEKKTKSICQSHFTFGRSHKPQLSEFMWLWRQIVYRVEAFQTL